MDLKGSLVDTYLKIFPSEKLLNFLQTIPIDDDIPKSILKLVKGKEFEFKTKKDQILKPVSVQFNDKDLKNLQIIKETVNKKGDRKPIENGHDDSSFEEHSEVPKGVTSDENRDPSEEENEIPKKREGLYLSTSEIDWLYDHLKKRRVDGQKDIPYLHELLEGAQIELPENQILKRNPDLEARCVKLRSQQEAREYRKMTKGVDNVRIRYPEDSISYQMKQLNRQLIAIGQFILSIFAGFLFGFKGVEWMVGPLDFGFKLLLGVMCSLVIALAEIYFLAKKLNEELSIPETVQLGGPPKFADDLANGKKASKHEIDKEHQD